jgi:hypothetical protein
MLSNEMIKIAHKKRNNNATLSAYLTLRDLVVGDLVDFMVGPLVESLDPLASLGLLVFLLTLGPLVDLRVGDLLLLLLEEDNSLAMTLAQMIAKMRKRVLREFILFVCLFYCGN